MSINLKNDLHPSGTSLFEERSSSIWNITIHQVQVFNKTNFFYTSTRTLVLLSSNRLNSFSHSFGPPTRPIKHTPSTMTRFLPAFFALLHSTGSLGHRLAALESSPSPADEKDSRAWISAGGHPERSERPGRPVETTPAEIQRPLMAVTRRTDPATAALADNLRTRPMLIHMLGYMRHFSIEESLPHWLGTMQAFLPMFSASLFKLTDSAGDTAEERRRSFVKTICS